MSRNNCHGTRGAGGRVACGVAEVRYRGLREEAPVVAHNLTLQLQSERGVLTVLAPASVAPSTAQAPEVAAVLSAVPSVPAASVFRAPVEGAYVKVFARVDSKVQPSTPVPCPWLSVSSSP